jgi:hypothetical protein
MQLAIDGVAVTGVEFLDLPTSVFADLVVSSVARGHPPLARGGLPHELGGEP